MLDIGCWMKDKGMLHECELSRKNPQFRKTQFYEIGTCQKSTALSWLKRSAFVANSVLATSGGSAGSGRQHTR